MSAATDGPWRRSRPVWRIAGSVVAVFMLVSGVARVVGVLAERREPIDRAVGSEGVDGVQIEVADSDLEVVGADVDRISITGTITSGLRRSELDVETRDGRVYVTTTCGGRFAFHDCGSDLVVEVPHALDVSVDAPNSEVTLRELTGAVTASSSNSSMVATSLDGPLRLRATNGSVLASGLRSSRVDVRTSNDDVELGFIAAPRSVVVSTSNAGATVVVPETEDFYDLRLRTSNAETSASVRSDPDSDRRVQVSTSNDDIVVRYPG